MKQIKSVLTRCLVATVTCFGLFAFTAHSGLDYYEIYLNNDLVKQWAVNQPASSRVLRIDKAKTDDRLEFKYVHCMHKGPGTDRSIILQDAGGNMVKSWSFANTGVRMPVAIASLRNAQQLHSKSGLRLYYKSKELATPELLSALDFE